MVYLHHLIFLQFYQNKYNHDDVTRGRSLSIKDAYEILSIPLIGIVYDDHDIIESHNKGLPLYLDKNSLVHTSKLMTTIASWAKPQAYWKPFSTPAGLSIKI